MKVRLALEGQSSLIHLHQSAAKLKMKKRSEKKHSQIALAIQCCI